MRSLIAPARFMVGAAVLVACWSADAQAASPWRGIKTPHFVVLAMTEEFDAGKVTEDDLRTTAKWFENIYASMVEQLKVLPPAGPPAKAGATADPRVVVFVYDWAKAGPYKDDETARKEALAFHTKGTIHLKLADLRSGDLTVQLRQIFTITHELFHAVQRAYDGSTRFSWKREATAQWAVWLSTLTDDTDELRSREMRFLNNTHLPLGYFENLATNPVPGASVGHPYGASILFRFLSEHHGGGDLLKKYMDAWQASPDWDRPGLDAAGGSHPATDGYHPLGLAAKILGTKGPDDPAFREIYDRFTVACALGPDAPAYPLADAARFRRGAARGDSGWDRHYLDVAQSPDDVVYQVPAVQNEQDIAVGTSTREFRDDVAKILIGGTQIGTGGFRCLTIPRPNGLAPHSTLRVEVVAEEGELSVQGLIRRRPDQPAEVLAGREQPRAVEVVKGRYDPKRFAYILEIPGFETASDLDVKTNWTPRDGLLESLNDNDLSLSAFQRDMSAFQPGLGEALIVLTRYTVSSADDPVAALMSALGTDIVANNPRRENAVAYPVFISVATPPTVARFTLAQQRTIIYDARWVSHVNESGVLDARTRKVAHGDDQPLPTADPAAGDESIARARSSSRLAADLGDAEVEVWFSSPIPEATPPQLSLNGHSIALTPYAEEDRWRGTIPKDLFGTGLQNFQIRASAATRGSKLQLPLDEDPLTIAKVQTPELLDPTAVRTAEWKAYERSKGGMLITLGLTPAKREITYTGLVTDGRRLYKPDEVAPDGRKVIKSASFVFIELDTGTVGGNIVFHKQREPQGSAVDKTAANLFSHVTYNYKLPETARGELIVPLVDARFEASDEEGPNIWLENVSIALYRGDDLAIAGYPEFNKHFLVVFTGKPDRATLDQILTSQRDSLPPSVRAVLLPTKKAGS